MKIIKVSAVTSVLLSAFVFSGCSYASKEEVKQLKEELSDTRAVADKALASANDAHREADEALNSSKETEIIVNRSYKQSMRK